MRRVLGRDVLMDVLERRNDVGRERNLQRLIPFEADALTEAEHGRLGDVEVIGDLVDRMVDDLFGLFQYIVGDALLFLAQGRIGAPDAGQSVHRFHVSHPFSFYDTVSKKIPQSKT